MPTATKETSKLRHNPIFPVDLVRLNNRNNMHGPDESMDHTNALWPWYLAPWIEPDVSPETRDYVLGTYTPEDENERSVLLTELAEMPTVRSVGMNPIVQQPGAIASERGYQRASGMRIISRVRGEPNDPNQPLEIRGPSVDDDPEYGSTGLKNVVKELERRQPWALAQLDAKIEAASEMALAGDNTQRRYYRRIVSDLKRVKRRWEVGIPTVQELERWFLTFERMRIQSRQSAAYAAEQARQQQVRDLDAQIAGLTESIEAEWQDAGVPA